MNIINDMLAIAEKEIKLSLRFKIPFFTGSMVEPFIRIAPFLLVYFGFFSAGAQSFGGVTESNFVVFLILGMLIDLVLVEGYTRLYIRFMEEKYWQTIEAMLLAPINKLSLLGGQALSLLVGLFPSMLLFLGVSFVLIPTTIQNIILSIAVVAMVMSIALSIGLIYASSALFNENFDPLFKYARVGLVFISCFYYPITIFDTIPVLSLLKPIVIANPLYQAITIIRSAWIYGTIEVASVAYVAAFAIIAPLLAVFIFNKLWKKLNIQGY
ncbi:MAG: hypothetical protein CL943_00220 [Candidatus Diapherotrites archaeon]|uniref:ABC transmembrane type-2 domain-containing protein n=1 Tax=Candidatus Iainarchaeum sp. TaxID=3101447 RepID=A0A2D6LZV8_9ARCH|nr:hypothetical protein [Candidatus Diapherotrites archaeon]|tara:strand:+ start:694 stop:1500 length:807 start_codon:yes stop_codon:yes gene_type:complete